MISLHNFINETQELEQQIQSHLEEKFSFFLNQTLAETNKYFEQKTNNLKSILSKQNISVHKAVIEIPKYNNIKYEEEDGNFSNHRYLSNNRFMIKSFPCDYGYIPNTLSNDGDPVDVALIIPSFLPPIKIGTTIDIIPLFTLKMLDYNLKTDVYEEDNKIIAISVPHFPFFLTSERNNISYEILNFILSNHIKNSFGKKIKLLNLDNTVEEEDIITSF